MCMVLFTTETTCGQAEPQPLTMKRQFSPFTKRWELPFYGHQTGSVVCILLNVGHMDTDCGCVSYQVYSGLITSDGQHVITSATDGTHKVWDAISAKGRSTMDGHSLAHSSRPCLVCVSVPATWLSRALSPSVWHTVQGPAVAPLRLARGRSIRVVIAQSKRVLRGPC